MIEIAKGNLLMANVEALVNPVNCIGVMGAGLARQFKMAFPQNFQEYARGCRIGVVKPGKMVTYKVSSLGNPKWIINFPTKRHWRDRSRIGDIESGLDALATEIIEQEIKSIAIPPLGCGLGWLDWNDVKPMIEQALEDVVKAGVKILLYTPQYVK